MEVYTLILPNGEVLSSGVAGEDALCRVQLTRAVSDTNGFGVGACCAAMLEAEIFYYNAPPIRQADALQLYVTRETGTELLGRFYAENPEISGANRMRLTAYDTVSRLDRDLSSWLAALDGWPYSAWELANMVCGECGVTLEDTPLPNKDYQVPAFTGQVTGRRLLQWLGQIFGSFLTATPQGNLRYGWYRDNDRVRIGPFRYTEEIPLSCQWQDGVLNLQIPAQWEGEELALTVRSTLVGQNLRLFADTLEQYPYQMDGLTEAGFATEPIRRVCIRVREDDVGVAYPREEEGTALDILGNPMLQSQSADALLPVAEALYERFAGFTYTPVSVTLAQWQDIAPGDRITVFDTQGNAMSTLVMTHRLDRGQLFLESTGTASPESTGAVNAVSHGSLAGKLLRLNMDLEGLRLENAQGEEALARLELTVRGLGARVENQELTAQGTDSRIAELDLTAQGLALEVSRLRTEGTERVTTSTGYTFDERGLTISKDGQTMENRLDNTGMYVRRAGNVILQANDAGVKAVDVQVENYLILGRHSRLEDYNNGTDSRRTACFYIDREETR